MKGEQAPVYIRSDGVKVYVRAQTWSLRKDPCDSIVPRSRSGEEYRETSAALEAPTSTEAADIHKGRTAETTRTLPGAGHHTLSNCGRTLKDLPDQEPDGHSGRAPAALLQCSSPVWPVCSRVQTEATPEDKAHESPPGVGQKFSSI